MALARPDVFPVGDLAVIKGMHDLDGACYESADAVIARASYWRPCRSVATRLIWLLDLANRNRLEQITG